VDGLPSMDSGHADQPRLPSQPYPGLRPFLDHEAPLLMGRSAQVREVVRRLEQSHFVAVVGGSGSGKSSLLRAGVVPRLRSSGVGDSGTYWIPVICTPGTTAGAVEGAEAARHEPQSPVSRLAWKLSQVLRPTGTAEGDRERRLEIEEVFKRGAGFSRLLDAYHDELPPRGPATADARFLFVVDQFEELFHPNNRHKPEARLMVEAVISHFFNPHPRCFVVLTMRSEHLADCAAYLELPDAINKSLYLVRRLNEQELRDAIIGPAQYYLRLCHRAAGGERLPVEVIIDDTVVQRLLRDALAICDDADHLPLLQHALARLWQSACERHGLPCEGVPPRIEWEDLQAAAGPSMVPGKGGPPIDDSLNVLRAVLENWAEFIYQQRTPQQRVQIDVVLRRLAFKDPNNGLYFQQRLEVDDPKLFVGIQDPAPVLRDLLLHGYLDSVNYLFWDREDPEHVTLKVSHESFIRGWRRFRDLIDAEAVRFDEFLSVLRRCSMWTAQRDPTLLLEPAEIARLDSLQLGQVFESDEERSDWFGVLLQYRDGQRLSELESAAVKFIRESRKLRDEEDRLSREALEREQQHQLEVREARERGLREREVGRRNRALAVMTFVLLAGVMSVSVLQDRVMSGVESFMQARALVDRSDLRGDGPQPGAARRKLEQLLNAARDVRAGFEVRSLFDTPLMRHLDVLGPVRKAERLLTVTSTEGEVNQSLRALLTSSLWVHRPDDLVTAPAELKMARFDRTCDISGPNAAPRARQGSLFVDTNGTRIDGRQRALFVTSDTSQGDLSLHAVMYDGKACNAGPEFWIVPGHIQPRILLDARLRYMALSQRTEQGDFVTLYEIGWQFDGANLERVGLDVLSVSADPDHLAEIKREFEGTQKLDDGAVRTATVVKTWRAPGGYLVKVGQRHWRLFNSGVQAIAAPGRDEDWEVLQSPAKDSACSQIGAPESPNADWIVKSRVLAWNDRCIEILRTQKAAANGGAGASAAAPAAAWDDTKPQRVDISLYEVLPADPGAGTASQRLRRVAGFKAFDRRPTLTETTDWAIGKTSHPTHAGWLALRVSATPGSPSSSATGGGVSYLGAPLTTEALAALGEQALRAAKELLPERPASAPSRPASRAAASTAQPASGPG